MTAEPAPPIAARVFNPITAIWLVLVGVFAFSALMVLSTYAPDLRSGDDGDNHALSHSAIGFAGAVELLKEARQPVTVSHAKLSPGHAEGLLVATPGPMLDPKAIKGLGFGGPVLVVLPKWTAAPDLKHRGWIGAAEPIDLKLLPKDSFLAGMNLARRPGVVAPRLQARSAPFDIGDTFAAGPVEQLQSIQSATLVPILTDDTGAVLLARDPKAYVFYLSDPDLLNNHGLKSVDTALAAVHILSALKAADGPVIVKFTAPWCRPCRRSTTTACGRTASS